MASNNTSSALVGKRSPSVSKNNRRNKSAVWNFVRKDANNIKHCQVEHCTQTWSSSTGSSSIATHLPNIHQVVLKYNEKEEDEMHDTNVINESIDDNQRQLKIVSSHSKHRDKKTGIFK